MANPEGRASGPGVLPALEGMGGSVPAGGPVVVAISGGVDSAVAARLLLGHGYDVLGVHFRLTGGARSDRAREAAGAVADAVGIPLRAIDLSETFLDKVIRPFCDAYRAGRTPSPCVRCNPLVKFATLFAVAEGVGAPIVATGHYARRITGPAGAELRRGRDPRKDQSYFLHRLPAAWLARTVFPLGTMLKTDVVAAASAWGIPVAGGESRDICFIDGDDYRAVLSGGHGGLGVSGRIIDGAGRVLGCHDGIAGYTVGQRRGLGLGGGPWYVLSIDPASGDVVVGQGGSRCSAGLTMDDAAWIRGEAPAAEFRAEVAVRYRQRPVPCTCRSAGGGGWDLAFDLPTCGVAPGQSAVLYDGDLVLGGGVIGSAVDASGR